MSQSQQTGLWSKSQSFFTAPHISKYIEVKSYTTQIAFESDMINPIRSLKVSIAGSATTIWLNGEKHTIAPSAPVEIEIPSAVTLNIVQESTDLSARAFTVLDNGTKKEYKSDPAKMNSEKLKQLSTVDGLKSAGVNADEATLKETATRIDNLCKQGDALDSGKKCSPIQPSLDVAFRCDHATNYDCCGLSAPLAAQHHCLQDFDWIEGLSARSWLISNDRKYVGT